MMTKINENLLYSATLVRNNAHAPYSNFKVGAAFLLKDGTIFSGANVENCALPLSVCAERNALAAAVASGARPGEIEEGLIVLDSPVETSPCGACRQVMAEFMNLDCAITVYNLHNESFYKTTLGDLLPKAFTPKSLT